MALLGLHAALLAYSAWCHSPVIDEMAHLPAGLCHLRFGSFDLYQVNPPLVRMVAALPVSLASPATDWSHSRPEPGERMETYVGLDFQAANGPRVFWLFTLARWGCIPFSLLGGGICFLWARSLYGPSSGLLALFLWCFCPNILGNAACLVPDVGAAALGAAACFLFWRWASRPSLRRALLAGGVLGLAELTKLTLLILYPLLPALWLFARTRRDPAGPPASLRRELAGLLLIAVVSLYVLNLGYAFEGSFRRLGDYEFSSRTLRGEESLNRFSGTLLAGLPVPLPSNYVMGIDLQKKDFEKLGHSYLRGEMRDRGWWYYYLYALGVKTPLGTLALFAGAVAWRFSRASGRTPAADEAAVLLPMVAILAFVSAQAGFSHHVRYALPALPFAFIWASKLAESPPKHGWRMALAFILAGWGAASSLSVYPHSLSYFHELAGGPGNGHFHLINSNIAWGQDLFFIKKWADDHPEARPLHLAHYGYAEPSLAGIDDARFVPLGPASPEARSGMAEERQGPQPGWYAVDVNYLRGMPPMIPVGPDGPGRVGPGLDYQYFRLLSPVDRVAYSTNIYHVTPQEADRVRRLLGLGPCTSTARRPGDAAGAEPGRPIRPGE